MNMSHVVLSVALAVTLTGCLHAPSGAMPGQVRQEPPPGMVEVEVVSTDGRVWDVFLGDTWEATPACSTPCVQWVDPRRPLYLYTRGAVQDRVAIPFLSREIAETRSGLLVATGSQHGKNVLGIVFTTLGGMGTVIGTTFTAIGCSDVERRGGICNGGLITLGVSLPVTAVSIWMMVDALPHVDLVPVYRTELTRGQPVSVAFGPGWVNGTF